MQYPASRNNMNPTLLKIPLSIKIKKIFKIKKNMMRFTNFINGPNYTCFEEKGNNGFPNLICLTTDNNAVRF